MPRSASAVVLSCLLSAAALGQAAPPGMSLAGTYTPVAGSLGGIMFDPSGATLYVAAVAGTIYSVPVLRNASNQVVGFGAATVLTAAPGVDGGLDNGFGGVWLWTTWPGHSLGQLPPGGAATLTSLATTGVPSSTGGLEIVPAFMPNAGELLVSSYSSGGIYRISVTPGPNGTVVPVAGSAVLFASTPAGAEGFTHIPGGPLQGHVISANYNTGSLTLIQINLSTGMPTGQSATLAGITTPMDVAFDPLTNDLFVSTYTSAANLTHYTGTLAGTFQLNQPAASLDVNGQPGTILQYARTAVTAGTGVTVNWASTNAGLPFDIAVSAVAPVASALTLPSGQLVNIDVASPFVFVFGGFQVPFFPASIPAVLPVGMTSAQMAVVSPGGPDGLALSQAVGIDVLACTYFETIDSTPVGVGNYPAGWSDGGGTNPWQVHTGATTSTLTGPDFDHTTGSGRYMYCETSISGTGIFILNLGTYSVAAGANADFWHHMYGSTIGTLRLEQQDPLGAWNAVWTLSGDQGNVWHHVQAPLSAASGSATLRFHYTWGGSFTGDAAIDDFGICY